LNTAILALEDGTVFEGMSFGAPVERTGEVVFNTAITGYQEVFTDPSYSGQIVILTYPQIGNYGANEGDSESAKPYIEGLVVRDFSPLSSNWRADETAQQFLTKSGVPVISGIDTRRLVRHLRSRGVMRGALAGAAPGAKAPDAQALIEKARNSPSMAGLDLATRVSTSKLYTWDQPVEMCSPSDLEGKPAEIRHHVVAYDFGMKRNILRRLVHAGCRRRRHGAEAGRSVSLERSRRSRAAHAAGRAGGETDRQGPDFRNLPGASGAGARARRQDLQVEVWTSRFESSGD
jgi:carbamoyl-phosphate synthase small subunit